MNFPDLPKWQLIAIPATIICLAIFYVAKYFVADELIYANYHVTALQLDLEDALEQLEAEQAKVAVVEREADVLRRANALLRNSERNARTKSPTCRPTWHFTAAWAAPVDRRHH